MSSRSYWHVGDQHKNIHFRTVSEIQGIYQKSGRIGMRTNNQFNYKIILDKTGLPVCQRDH